MRITDITITMHERSSPRLAVFGTRDGKLPMGVLRIGTDVGLEGTTFLSYPGPGPLAIAREIVTFVKPLLVGADPLQIGRHWRRLCNLGHFINPITVGVVDVALWDIAGRAAGLPVHQLLGNCRDRLPVYLSSAHHASARDYAEEAAYWREQGWRGYKLHPLVHAILSGLLLSADHDLRAQLDAPPRSIGPTAVRRAHEYIEQHAHEPLTVAQVAASAGVSTRALQQGFQRSLGATPHQIIQHIRLERAHHDLVNSSTDEATVAGIGAKWGFPHAGRFAAQYHSRYNTYPSTTLRYAATVR